MPGRTGAQYGHLARLEHLSHPTSSPRISTQNLSACTGTRSWTQAHKLGAGSQRSTSRHQSRAVRLYP
jgi:hypothetical protein